MRRMKLLLWVASGLAVTFCAAQGAPSGTTVVEASQHRLLKLDLQEAIQHARTLSFEVRGRAAIEREPVERHLDEIGRNLDGIDRELEAIQAIDGDERFDFQVAEIRNHTGLARECLDRMDREMAKARPDPQVIAGQAAAIYAQMTRAVAHERTTAGKHHVVEGPPPTVE